MEKMERSKIGQREKLSSAAVLIEASTNLQGVPKLRWPCKVVLNWGRELGFYTLIPATYQFSLAQTIPVGAVEGCLLASFPVAGRTSLSSHHDIYHNRKHNLCPKELWGCRPILSPSIKIASRPFSYLLGFLQERIRHQAFVFFKLQEMHIKLFR